MCPRFQIVRCACAPWSVCLFAAILLGMLAVCAASARAQQPPPGALGEVEGNDVTVDGGTAAMVGTSTKVPGIFVSNGSLLTVHSGQAVMKLFEGGEVDICGPAKITILRSSDAITLALNFGRMRVQLPPKTALRVFTPTVIGTPLDISGGARDITMGLNLDNSMCVLAGSGAIQLANQFTDQTLIVPQSGEFFLNAGQLQPVAGKPGSCQCVATRPPPPPAPATIPEFAQATPAAPTPRNPTDVGPLTAPPAIADQPLAAVLPAPQPGEPPAPRIEYSVPASVSQAHPVVPVTKQAPAGGAPAVSEPVYTAVLPALTFSASSPEPPDDLTPDMTLLIREARVEPEWGFTGTVAAPEFVAAMQKSLGVESAKQPPAANATPQKKKGGFWSSLKRLFGGSKQE